MQVVMTSFTNHTESGLPGYQEQCKVFNTVVSPRLILLSFPLLWPGVRQNSKLVQYKIWVSHPARGLSVGYSREVYSREEGIDLSNVYAFSLLKSCTGAHLPLLILTWQTEGMRYSLGSETVMVTHLSQRGCSDVHMLPPVAPLTQVGTISTWEGDTCDPSHGLKHWGRKTRIFLSTLLHVSFNRFSTFASEYVHMIFHCRTYHW